MWILSQVSCLTPNFLEHLHGCHWYPQRSFFPVVVKKPWKIVMKLESCNFTKELCNRYFLRFSTKSTEQLHCRTNFTAKIGILQKIGFLQRAILYSAFVVKSLEKWLWIILVPYGLETYKETLTGNELCKRWFPRFLTKNTEKLKKKLYGPFLWMGFNCLKTRTTSRKQFTFCH